MLILIPSLAASFLLLWSQVGSGAPSVKQDSANYNLKLVLTREVIALDFPSKIKFEIVPSEYDKRKEAERVAEALKTRQQAIRGQIQGSPSYDYDPSVKVVGTSYLQCIVWARQASGIQVYGYAGNVKPNTYEPVVGSVAIWKSIGHVGVVKGVENNNIIVWSANWVKGKVVEQKLPISQFKGFVI